jgi:hypothetical protein
MSSLEFTPMPLLPEFDNVTPMTPKRVRRVSEALHRRVRANLSLLSIPDIQSPASVPLLLQPQGRGEVTGLSFDKILLGGAGRNKAAAAAKTLQRLSPPQQNIPLRPVMVTTRISPVRKTAQTPAAFKTSPLKSGGDNPSLMSLRMAAMLKGSIDAKAQLKFGNGLSNKSFQVPGRALSGPYRPSRANPMRNRSFNALCV